MAEETPWYSTIPNVATPDPELIGHMTNKGWHDKTPAEAAYLAAKAHREAEKLVGVPADQLLRLPKDATDEAGWNNVWSRLGAGKEAKDYDLSAVKRADGTDLEAAFADQFKAAAVKFHLPKDAAAGIAKEFAGYLDKTASSEQVEREAKVAVEKTELAKNWGANFEANKFVASQAAKALGIGPEVVQALENAVGYSKVMEMFRNIGSKIGEDKFVKGDLPLSGVMTKDQAKAKLTELKNDTAWGKRLLEGDVAARRELEGLTRLIAGDDTDASRKF